MEREMELDYRGEFETKDDETIDMTKSVSKDATVGISGVETTLENIFQAKMEHDADLLRIAQEEDVEKC